MTDDQADDDDKLAALRALLDEGVRELDAGLGVETSPEDVTADVIAQLFVADIDRQ